MLSQGGEAAGVVGTVNETAMTVCWLVVNAAMLDHY